MKPTTKLLLFAAMVIATLVPASAVTTGQPAPDFTLTDLDGRPQTLSSHRGKTVVLEWHNPDCPIVRKHYESGNIPETQRSATGSGVVWLSINSGAPGQQGADYTAAQLRQYFAKTRAAPTAYLRDQEGKVGRSYGARTTPHIFIVNSAGTLVYQGAIDSISSANVADIQRATNYVRTVLEDLSAGRPVAQPNTQPYGCAVHY